MQFIKRLKTILQYDDISGILIYIIPSIILLLLSNIYTFLLIFYVIYQIYLFKRHKTLFYYSLFISIFLLLVYFVYYIIYKTYQAPLYIKGVITDSDDNSFLLKDGLHYFRVYYNKIEELKIGKQVSVEGRPYEIIERNVERSFSHFRNNLSKRIISDYQASNVLMNDKSITIYSLKGLIFEYIDNTFDIDSSMFIKRLVFGKQTFNSEINDSINNIGIIYLFCISGLHVGILSLLIKRLLRLFNAQEELISIILIIILIIYYFITAMSSSVTRSIIMTIISEISLLINKKMPRIDSLVYSFVICLLINPFYIFQIGFYLTYLSTLIIFLSKEKKLWKLTLLIILFTTPILLYSNQKISLFIFFNCLLFGVVFSTVFIPFTYIVLIISPFEFIYQGMINVLLGSINLFNEIDVSFYFSISNIYYLLLIYVLLFVLINRKKDNQKYKFLYILILLTLSLNYFTSSYVFFPEVSMIDVGQGDSILIRNGFDTYLIDTGVKDKYNTLTKYLNQRNIYKINAVFISHNDSDHMGDLDNLKENIKIDEMYSGLDGLDLDLKGLKFHSFALSSSNKNEGSMVLYLEIYNATFLFTGDIENEGENNILSKDIRNITFLKVAHHGSITSSKEELIKKLNPKVSLISVGANNKYGHPSKEVLERLEKIDSLIYRTDNDGTIKITIMPFISYIKTYRNDELTFFERLDNHRFIIH